MRISDWSSDVCSSDLRIAALERGEFRAPRRQLGRWFSVRHDKVQSKGMKGGPPSGADAFDLEPEGIAAFEPDMNMRGIAPRTGRDAGDLGLRTECLGHAVRRALVRTAPYRFAFVHMHTDPKRNSGV